MQRILCALPAKKREDSRTQAVSGIVGPTNSFFLIVEGEDHHDGTKQEAIRRANDTTYGLGAAVFTRDLESAHRVAAEIEITTTGPNTSSRAMRIESVALTITVG
jgi:hypothetical protein